MKLQRKIVDSRGIRLSFKRDSEEVARAYLYIFHNDLHKEPVGFLEDVFVDENFRGQGFGKEIVRKVIEEAKNAGCYKIVATSRHSKPGVHNFYLNLNFRDHGIEFRVDL